MKYFALILLLALSGCVEDRKRAEYEAAGCIYDGTIELTDQPKKYCGKACFRYVRRMQFTCPDPKGTYHLYYDY
jgi:hypothetical protein